MDIASVPFLATGTIDSVQSGDIIGWPGFDLRLGTLVEVTLGGSYSVRPEDVTYLGPDIANGSYSTFFVQANFDLGGYAPGSPTVSVEQVFGLGCRSDDGSACPAPSSFPSFSVPGTIAATSLGSSIVTPPTAYWVTSSTVPTFGIWQGGFAFDGAFTVSRTYMPKSTRAYVNDFIVEASSTASGAISIAVQAQQSIANLRSGDAGTSVNNLALRDAEYAFYGYKSGAQFATGSDLRDAFLAGSPFSVIGYNAFKDCALASSVCGKVWTAIWNSPPGQTSDKPPSPSGGLGTNSRAFWHGLNNPGDITGLPEALDGAGVPGPAAPPTTPTNPLLPFFIGPLGGANEVELNLFILLATADTATYVDPVLNNLFSYAVAGNTFVAIEIPVVPSLQSVGRAQLTVDGRSVMVNGGAWYSFMDLFGVNPTVFTLGSITGDLLPEHLTLGFKFSSAGETVLASVSSPVAVPEPGTWLLLAAGLAAMALMRRNVSGSAGTYGRWSLRGASPTD